MINEVSTLHRMGERMNLILTRGEEKRFIGFYLGQRPVKRAKIPGGHIFLVKEYGEMKIYCTRTLELQHELPKHKFGEPPLPAEIRVDSGPFPITEGEKRYLEGRLKIWEEVA